jgi:uncharacterized caspase-like protein
VTGEARVLIDLLRNLSASDGSVLLAVLDTPDSQIATVANSANDRLWSTFVAHGFAQELTLDLDERLRPAGFQPRTYALTNAGRDALPQLLHDAFDDHG